MILTTFVATIVVLDTELAIEEAAEPNKSRPLYKCDLCAFCTATTNSLKDHKKNKHTKEETFTNPMYLHSCIACDFETNDFLKLMNHIKETHKPKPTSMPAPPSHKCDLCEFVSDSVTSLQSHIESHHRSHMNIRCTLCEFDAVDKNGMKQHIETNHNQDIQLHVIKALNELKTVVKTLTDDIHQIKCDSIMMNNDLLNSFKDKIIEEVKEHVSNKFEIIDRRVDRVHQKLVEIDEISGNKECDKTKTKDRNVDTSKEKKSSESAPKVKEATKESYAKKARSGTGNEKVNIEQPDPIPEKEIRKEVLVVGTSITNNLDKRVCANATNLNIDVATAYTVDADIDARYKEKNFMTIVPERLMKKKYDTLVLQGGSIEITNLNTKDEEEDPKNWKKKVEASSTKMFNLAEKSIEENPGLEVIIVERIPRFDSISNDPKQIKSQLSLYANSIYRNLWVEKGCPKNIQIQDLGLNCYGALREKRFGIPGTRGVDGKYVDGIHMRGILAVKHYTDSFIRMFRPYMTISQAGRQSWSDNHTRCPQSVYQRHRGQYTQYQRRGNTQGGYRKQTNRGFSRNNSNFNQHGYNQDENVHSYGKNTYTIPVQNRFPENC